MALTQLHPLSGYWWGLRLRDAQRGFGAVPFQDLLELVAQIVCCASLFLLSISFATYIGNDDRTGFQLHIILTIYGGRY